MRVVAKQRLGGHGAAREPPTKPSLQQWCLSWPRCVWGRLASRPYDRPYDRPTNCPMAVRNQRKHPPCLELIAKSDMILADILGNIVKAFATEQKWDAARRTST